MDCDRLIENIKKYGIFFVLLYTSATSYYLFIWELTHWSMLPNYIIDNALTSQDQTQILLGSLLSLFALALPLFIISARSSSTAVIEIFLKSISLLFLIPVILNKDLCMKSPFIMAVITFILGIYLYRALKNLTEWPSLKIKPLLFDSLSYFVLALLVLGYAFFFSYCSIIGHYHFLTRFLDFGFIQNAFVNTVHGHFMALSFPPFYGASVFRDHGDFILLAYLPFFYFFPRSETLLIVQSISISLAAIPLFLLSRQVLKSTFAALIIALVFLLQPANHDANLSDIHQLSFLPLCTFCVFYFLEKENLPAFLISILFLLSIKMDMFVILLMITLFILFSIEGKQKFKIYCLLLSMLYGAVYFFFLKNWMLYSHWYLLKKIMLNCSGGLGEILKTMATNPIFVLKTAIAKNEYLFLSQLLGPLLFIPLLRKQNYLLLIYGLVATLLATHKQCQIYNQYVWLIVPFLFIGLIYTLKDMRTEKIIRAILIAVLFSSLIYCWQYSLLSNRGKVDLNFTPKDKKRLQTLDDMIDLIPPGASVSASRQLMSHLVKQANVSLLTCPKNTGVYPLQSDHRRGIHSDYLLDFRNDCTKQLKHLKTKSGYKLISDKEGILLFRKYPE